MFIREFKKPLIAGLLLCVQSFSFADQAISNQPNPPKKGEQTVGGSIYSKPKAFTFLKNIPGDMGDVAKNTFKKENALGIALMVFGTGILIMGDQYLVDKSKNLGDHLGISHTNYQKTFVQIDVPLSPKSLNIEGPFDSGSTLYFIGDGWVDVWLMGGFLVYGAAKDNNRAIQTSSQLAESILASGIIVQTLKHVTGRESPFTTNTPGGTWRFFPNQNDYARHVPSYDAFPTGHLCAAMASVTVIADNYPEYRFVRPLGYSLMTVLGFQMLNNGVHWASDYPLGIYLGYAFAKVAVKKGRRPAIKEDSASLHFSPAIIGDGLGMRVYVRFPAREKDQHS